MRQRACVILGPREIARVEIIAARLASKKCSASDTRCPSVRSPSTVPRGLGPPIGMIAVIGTTVKKLGPPDFSETRSLRGARGTSAGAAIDACIFANIPALNKCRAIAGVRTSASNDDPKEVATLGAFERPHLVPSGNRRDCFYDPLDIASGAPCLRNHGLSLCNVRHGVDLYPRQFSNRLRQFEHGGRQCFAGLFHLRKPVFGFEIAKSIDSVVDSTEML
jgi:hypothetical protein